MPCLRIAGLNRIAAVLMGHLQDRTCHHQWPWQCIPVDANSLCHRWLCRSRFYMLLHDVSICLRNFDLTLRTAVQAASSSNFMWLLDFNFLKTWELSSRAIFGFKQPPSTLWRKNNKTAGSNDVDPPFTTIQHFTTIHTTARTNLSLSEKPFETFIQRSLLCPSPRSCRGAPSGENHHLLLGL